MHWTRTVRSGDLVARLKLIIMGAYIAKVQAQQARFLNILKKIGQVDSW